MSHFLVKGPRAARRGSRWRALARSAALLCVVCGWSTTLRGQVTGDSVARWTRALQSGTLDEKVTAVDGLSRMQVQALSRETVQALLAELNRVHQALLSGANVTIPGTSEDHSDYYVSLVGIVAGMRTPEAALALVPAVAVSSGVERRVARYGGDAVVEPLVDLVTRRLSDDDALETLGLVWFWADSTGSPLSDASRSQILATLGAAAMTGEHRQMLGVLGALREMGNPSLLALAQVLRAVAAKQGDIGHSTVFTLDEEVLPTLSTAAAARTNPALVQGIRRMVGAICGVPATGRRHGTCQSSINDVATAERHFENGQYGPARNVYASVADKLIRAKDSGDFTVAEYALLTGDLATLLARTW